MMKRWVTVWVGWVLVACLAGGAGVLGGVLGGVFGGVGQARAGVLSQDTTEPDAATDAVGVAGEAMPPLSRAYQAGTGPDRAGWPSLSVGPADGVTRHQPYYFPGVTSQEGPVEPVAATDDIAANLEAVLAGSEAGNWNRANGLEAVVDPVKFAVELVIIPYRMFLAPPWVEQSTP